MKTTSVGGETSITFDTRETIGYIVGTILLGIGLWYFIGSNMNVDLQNYEKLDSVVQETTRKYTEERKMRILYEALESWCREALNKEYEEHWIPAP